MPNKLELPLLPGSECEAAYPHYSALNQVCAGGEKGAVGSPTNIASVNLMMGFFTVLTPALTFLMPYK